MEPFNAKVLDSLQVAEPPNEVESTGRLSTGMCFVTFVQLGEQLKFAQDKFDALLNSSPRDVSKRLEDLIQHCRFAADKAEKLLKANK